MPKKKQTHSKDGSLHITDESINTITAIIGAILALGASSLLIPKVLHKDSMSIISTLVYVCTLCSMFIFSALHHAINGKPATNRTLRVLDYASIFCLITGTTMPLVFVRLNGYTPAIFMFITMLIVMAVGVSLFASISTLPKYISNTLFIALGWMPILLSAKLLEVLSLHELSLLISGGLVYSIGFILYSAEVPNIWPGKFGFHELWHCIVITGAMLHFMLIYSLVQ